MSKRDALIRLLADGELHSGPDLAASLGCSRAAVWKMLQAMPQLGLQIEALPARGYRLERTLDLLDSQKIRLRLSPNASAKLADFRVLTQVDSTSGVLRAESPPSAGKARLLFAEYQTAGRGRRGRQWQSPFASGLCFSLSWCFDHPPASMSALGLAMGIAVRDVLAGLQPLARLKWPNDIVTPEGKLAGLLVEADGEATGPIHVVVGVGINVLDCPRLMQADEGPFNLAPVSLARGQRLPARNELAARLLESLLDAFETFDQQGFAPFIDRWRQADAYHGQPVVVVAGQQRREGIARGIRADGALLLDIGGQVQPVLSGEVSLRPLS